MRKVIGIGETILDIIFRGEQPTAAVPGGSVFNGIVSLGRIGVPICFISETGNDHVGNIILNFMRENNIPTDHVNVFPDGKSPVSLAFLNNRSDAEYIFYKDYPKQRLDVEYPQIQEDDIVIIGSYYALNPVLRDKLFARIKEQTQGKEETQGKEKPRTIRMNLWKWAAAIVLPICIAFFTYYLIDSSQTVGAPFIVKADKGDKATIELPDGTNVVLNSASQLSYLNNFGENVRRVQLNGEAYFKVAHDEKHAFIVQVGDLEVKVLGTSFNVSAYEDAKDVTVVLLEGKVGVYAQKMSHIMKPGDKIEYNKATHKITATQVHPSDYIEWTKGNIYFEKESLENIMKTLSRIYDVEIRFDSNKLPNEYFTGTIPGGGIQNALNILMLTSPFYYEMDGSVIVLKEK